jgi:UDP-N-acetylglucosamine:LPS N-acetylglucosamine transferase
MASLPQLLAHYQVIHISGTLTWSQVEANLETLSQAERAYYRPYPYLHERMGAAFRAADLVVARAGASMLGEAPAFGLPSVLVPLTFAWRYQKVNADFLADQGCGRYPAAMSNWPPNWCQLCSSCYKILSDWLQWARRPRR